MENINRILTFWFPNTDYNIWWFKSNGNLDQQIYELYYDQMVHTFDDFQIDQYFDKSPEELVANIILLDQFSRNINRFDSQLKININNYTEKAYELSKIWIDKKYYLTQPIGWTVFAFLPVRHLGDKTNISNLIELLNQIENKNNLIIRDNIFSKFKLHTIRQLNFI
jgi:uncharacterized protein (DUF924 family)